MVGVVKNLRAVAGAEARDRDALPAGAASARRSETDRREGFIFELFVLVMGNLEYADDGALLDGRCTSDEMSPFSLVCVICLDGWMLDMQKKTKRRELID